MLSPLGLMIALIIQVFRSFVAHAPLWVHVAILHVFIWVPKIAYSCRQHFYDTSTYFVPDHWTRSSNKPSSISTAPDSASKGTGCPSWIACFLTGVAAFEFLPWLYEVFFNSVALFARRWHDFEVHYPPSIWDNFHKTTPSLTHSVASSSRSTCPLPRNCLLVGYHSRPTLDLVYTIAHIRPAALVSQLLFEVPFMESVLSQGHFMPSSKPGRSSDAVFYKAVVSGSRPVLLLPGGAHECAKDYDQRYKVQWKTVPGFARVLLSKDSEFNHKHNLEEHKNDLLGDDAIRISDTPSRLGVKAARHTPVIPFFVTNCEDILYTHNYWYTLSGRYIRSALNELRERGAAYKLPAIMTIAFFCLGCHLLPRPVKLDLYFGDPLVAAPGETSEAFAGRVRDAMQRLIDTSMAQCRDRGYSCSDIHSDRGISSSSSSSSGGHKSSKMCEDRSLLRKIRQYPIYAFYTLVQNALIVLFCVTLFISLVPVGVAVQYLVKWSFCCYTGLHRWTCKLKNI